MADTPLPESSGSPVTLDRRVAEEIARALAGLRFGSVELTVHDGKITQIETTRKTRLA